MQPQGLQPVQSPLRTGFPKKDPACSILSWASEVVFRRRSGVSVAGQFLLRREARADREAVKPPPSPRRVNPVCPVVAARYRAPLTRGVSAVHSIVRPPSRGRVGGMVRAIFSSVLRKRTGPRTCLLGCRQLPSASTIHRARAVPPPENGRTPTFNEIGWENWFSLQMRAHTFQGGFTVC